jgi:hypothetical protein
MTLHSKFLAVLLLIIAAFQPTVSSAAYFRHQTGSQSPKPAAPEARKLAPEIVAQHQKFQRLLPSDVKREIDHITPYFQKEVAHAKPGADLRALATAPIRKEFPHANPKQIAALVFELIAQSLGAPKDSMSDMSTQQQMQIQMTMDQRSQLEDILSNVLKTFEDTSDSVIQNIK